MFAAYFYMLTRHGIAYNLRHTPYIITTAHAVFHFSSNLYMTNFLNRQKEHRDIINYSLSKRFNINMQLTVFPDLVLYAKIEKRGFHVKVGNEVITCRNNIILSGEKLTKST